MVKIQEKAYPEFFGYKNKEEHEEKEYYGMGIIKSSGICKVCANVYTSTMVKGYCSAECLTRFYYPEHFIDGVK